MRSRSTRIGHAVRGYNIRVRPRFVDLLSLRGQLGRSYIFPPPFFSLFPFFPFFFSPSPHLVTRRKKAERQKTGPRAGGEAIESNRFENLIGGKHGKSITNFWIAIVSRRTSNINTFSFRYLYQWGTQRVYEYAPIFPVSVEHYAKGEKFDISYRIRSPTIFHNSIRLCVCIRVNYYRGILGGKYAEVGHLY